MTSWFPSQDKKVLPEEEDLEKGTSVSRKTISRPPSVGLGQGQHGLVNYGATATNASTTSCGLVILHTKGDQAVIYHWPFCSEKKDYEKAFDEAVGDREGTSIEVVVNGGYYSSGDSNLKKFGLYLQKQWDLPVTVYRQVERGAEQKTTDPCVMVERASVKPMKGYELVSEKL